MEGLQYQRDSIGCAGDVERKRGKECLLSHAFGDQVSVTHSTVAAEDYLFAGCLMKPGEEASRAAGHNR